MKNKNHDHEQSDIDMINDSEKKQQKKKKLSIPRLLLLLFLGAVLIVGAGGVAILFSIVQSAPKINPAQIAQKLDESSLVFDINGTQIEKLTAGGYREVVPLDRMPKDLQHAIIAIEDERFYQHNGIDIQRVGGAFVHNLKTMSFEQGASTLTMQLAKNVYTTQEKSVTRKIRDMYYALEIEKSLSKDDILHAYLNVSNFSRGAYGVQAAAKMFFNKDVSELDLAQSALIAGVTNRPSKYSPYNNEPITAEDNLGAIQINVLPIYDGYPGPTDADKDIYKKALNQSLITKNEYGLLMEGQRYLQKAVFNPESKTRQETILSLMLRQGYIDQAQHDAAVAEQIVIQLPPRIEKDFSTYYVDKVKKDAVSALKSVGFSSEDANAMLYNGGLRIHTALDPVAQKRLEEQINNRSYFYGSFTDDNGVVQPQVGAVIMDQYNGNVVAMVGGRNINGENILNRALVPRQPGSSIKPIAVFSTALEDGRTAADIYRDTPIVSGDFKPKNSTGYKGNTTMRNLLINSSNVGSFLIAKSLTNNDQESINQMVNMLKSMGVTSIVSSEQNPTHNDVTNYAALTLGGMTYGISPLEMAGAFASVANQGEYTKPVFVTKITAADDKTLYEDARAKTRVMSPQNAYILTDMMSDAVDRGTGRYANFGGMNIAGKTGTTNDLKDSWFVGYTPYYTASVWIGNDKPRQLADTSRMAAQLWRGIMRSVSQDQDNKEFVKPDGIVSKYVSGYREIFADGSTKVTNWSGKLGVRQAAPVQKTTKAAESTRSTSKSSTRSSSSSRNTSNSDTAKESTSSSKKESTGSSTKKESTSSSKKESTRSSSNRNSSGTRLIPAAE